MKPYQNQEFEDTEVSNVYSMYEPMMQPEIVSFNPDDVTRTEFNSQHNKGLLRHMSDNDLYHQMKFSQSEASQRLGVSISTLKRELHRRGIHVRWPYPKRKTKKDSLTKYSGKLQEMRDRISINLLVNECDFGEKQLDLSSLAQLLNSIHREKRRSWNRDYSIKEDISNAGSDYSDNVEMQNTEIESSTTDFISDSSRISKSYYAPPPLSNLLPPLPSNKIPEYGWRSSYSEVDNSILTRNSQFASVDISQSQPIHPHIAQNSQNLQEISQASQQFYNQNCVPQKSFTEAQTEHSTSQYYPIYSDNYNRNYISSAPNENMRDIQNDMPSSVLSPITPIEHIPQIVHIQQPNIEGKISPQDKALMFFTRRNSA